MVYVLSKEGTPLMPTNRHGRVRHLLDAGEAKAVKRCPFTIQLLYQSTTYTQEITLGVDAGSKTIGLSASTEKKELYASETRLRMDITDLLSVRRQFRRTRRNRKTRYRKARFNNRVHAKHKGWLAPGIEAKIGTHFRAVRDVCRILPVTEIIVETASFDIQKIKALENGEPVPEGTDYQEGDQLGFWNVREYVLWRDGYKCRCCNGKSKDQVLNVHHIESRKTGGDAPNNLATLCGYCHKQYHKGTILLPKSVRRGNSFRDAAFMGIMRWTFYNRLKEQYPRVAMTYGYITKNTRIRNSLPKTHYADARCIAGHPQAEPLDVYYFQKKVRCHNRQIHKSNILKGGKKKRNQAEYLVKGYRLYDRVRYQNREYYVFGRRASGFFDIRALGGNKVNKGSVSCKKLRFLEPRKTMLIERRMQEQEAV